MMQPSTKPSHAILTSQPSSLKILQEQTKGVNSKNTLLATSLCCDELACQLEDNFNGICGKNYTFEGLAGFLFAGQTNFDAMTGTAWQCLVPTWKLTRKESSARLNSLVNKCCGLAVAVSNYVESVTMGTNDINTAVNGFDNFQQQGIQ